MKLCELLLEKEINTPFNEYPLNSEEIMNDIWDIELNFINTHINKEKDNYNPDDDFRVIQSLGKPTIVNISQLYPFEPTINDELISTSTDLPQVYLYKNKMYVNNGNHRVSQAYLKGKQNIKVNLVDINDIIHYSGPRL